MGTSFADVRWGVNFNLVSNRPDICRAPAGGKYVFCEITAELRLSTTNMAVVKWIDLFIVMSVKP